MEKENEVQKFMAKQKHEFAEKCSCERCTQIVLGNNYKTLNDSITLLIDNLFIDFPELKTMKDWHINGSFESKTAATKCMEQISMLFKKYPISEILTFDESGEMIKKYVLNNNNYSINLNTEVK